MGAIIEAQPLPPLVLLTDARARLESALADRYRIERELGQGGMATVWLAHDSRHDRSVAIKVLKPELAAVLGAERFVVEIKTTARLQHPHILPLFDSGTADGFLYYVMPYIQGETIRDVLTRETQLDVADAVRITREVADALDYAHRHGVIHRDIKPENILLHDGRAMVMDFGIALAVSAAAGGRMTETGLSLGTPHYMSPEQATADKEISPRSDVYSLASVLFEMLAGQPPHVGGSAQQIIMKIVTDTPRLVSELRRSVPANVAVAVAKALEKLPADRFHSAAEFSQALANPGFTSSLTNVTASARPAAKRNLALAGGLALLAVGSAFLLGRTLAPAGTAPSPRPLSTFVVATLKNTDVGYLQIVNRFAVSRQGDKVAFLSEDSAKADRIFIRSLGTLEPRALAIGGSPFFSPDGKQVGFFQGYGLSSIAAEGGVPVRVAELRTQLPWSAAWGTDNKIRFTTDQPGPVLFVVAAAGGAIDSISFGPDTVVERGELIPRGRLLLSLKVGTASRIVIREFDGATHHLVDGVTARYAPSGALLFSRKEEDQYALMVQPFDSITGRLIGDARILQRGPSAMTPAEGTLAGDLVTLSPITTSDRTLTLMDPARGDRELPIPAGNWVGMTASPDEKSLMLSDWNGQIRSLWRVDIATGALQRLTRGSEWFGEAMEPGNRGFFAISPNRPHWLYRLKWDGSEPTQVDTPWEMYADQVSADGSTLYLNKDGDLYRMALLPSVGKPELLLQTAANEETATPSPDGKWLAWRTDRSGRTEVVVAPINAVDKAVQVSDGGRVRIHGWSRDSRTFYFESQGELHAVDIGPDGPRLAASRMIFRVPPRTIANRFLPNLGVSAVIRGGQMLTELIFSQGALR